MAGRVEGVADLMKILRSHGPSHRIRYRLLNGAMGAPCMHAGGLAAGSQTTASWVADLSLEMTEHWVTGTSAPCTGLFKPVRIAEPLDLGPTPSDIYDPATLWWRHEAFQRDVLCDPDSLMPLFAGERNEVEAQWLANPPEPREAFSQAEALLKQWREKVDQKLVKDTRPFYVRRYWKVRNTRAGL